MAGASVAATDHPCIFITAKDLARLRAMASDTMFLPHRQAGQPAYAAKTLRKNALGYIPAEAWKALQAKADAFAAAPPYHYAVTIPGREGGPGKRWECTLSKDPPPRHDDSPYYPPWTAMFQERDDSITTRLQYLLLAYVVSQDAKYFNKAKEIVLALCAWPGIWTDPSYGGGRPCLDTGHAAAWVGIFYDWCHAALMPEERATVRKALAEKALVPIDGYMDKVSPYHNYTAVVASGLTIGGIALLGEDPRAEGWIQHAIARALLNFDAQGKDGGAMEGPGYGTYATDNFADMIWALTTAEIPNKLVEHNYIKTMPRYCITLLNPNNWQQPCFGDGGPTAGFGRLMLSLALRGDTDAAWYCEKIGMLTPGSPRSFIALDPERVRPKQPTFNPSGCFVDIGYAILRDGYRRGTGFLALKCGPPEAVIGHNHLDQNSFVINYDGDWLAWDPGYRSYFNPPERRYTTSTLGHNSVVLDLDDEYLKSTADSVPGHDQVVLNKGRITEFFTSEALDYVRGEAAEAYNKPDARCLDRFSRQIVFVKPNVFFIRDTLAAPKEHTYSFLLHLDGSGEFEVEGQQVRALSTPYLLQTDVFSPAGISLRAAQYPSAENRGPYLAATTGKAKAATITSVLVPRRHGKLICNPGFERGMAGWHPRAMPGFTENHVIDTQVKHSGQKSARIDNGGYYYSSCFALPPGTKITARWWAKCTAAQGASSYFYYWKAGKSFASKSGPAANFNEWREYEMTDVVPEGTEEICLALQFFGKGQCWYDDVGVTADRKVPNSQPAVVVALDNGAGGAVTVVDGVTHVFLCGKPGETRTLTVAGHKVEADGELAVISLRPDGPRAFLLRGRKIILDGKPLSAVTGEWRLGNGE